MNILLKKYKDFLKENLEKSTENFDDIFNHFENIDLNITKSFRDMINVKAYTEKEIDLEVAQIINDLEEKYDKDYIVKFVQHYVDNDLEFRNICGVLDLVLYNYNKKYYVSSLSIEPEIGFDPIILYYYGWHTNKYGKICIEQNVDSTEEFYELCKNHKDMYTDYFITIEKDNDDKYFIIELFNINDPVFGKKAEKDINIKLLDSYKKDNYNIALIDMKYDENENENDDKLHKFLFEADLNNVKEFDFTKLFPNYDKEKLNNLKKSLAQSDKFNL